MKKIIVIVFLFAIILTAGAFIYFVSGVSSVTAPIKKFEYIGTVEQLVSGIRKYASCNPDISLKITDTTGSSYSYAIYMTIEIKSKSRDIEYGWKCEKSKNDKISETIIKLVEAYDITNNTGGYIKDAKGVNSLVDYFEFNFLIPLKKEQNINIIPL